MAGSLSSINTLDERLDALTSARTAAGARFQRMEQADLAATTVDLTLQEVAYQASLAAMSRVMQPSLRDFLR